MQVKRIAIAIALSICVASCGEGTTGLMVILARSGRRVKKVILVRLDLLVHQDRPDLRERKVLPRRLALRGHLQLTSPSALPVPTARRPHAERSATKTRCSSSHTVVRAGVL